MYPGCQTCLDDIPDVQIDERGTFKYVQIKVRDLGGKCKLIIRGNKCAEFHNDLYEPVNDALRPMGFDVECVGGGRMFRDEEKGVICAYGYSVAFGKADHAATCDLLRRKYPNLKDIRWSNAGY